jgi:transposase InsO family protein
MSMWERSSIMALTMQEKRHVGKEVALRYLHARKKEKGTMLQEFCATTGYSPPYAACLLRTYAKRVILGTVTLVPTRPSPLPRERKHVYGPAVVEALVWTYHLSGDLCGKRLQAGMPDLLSALERAGTTLPGPLHGALLRMGSATMDRLLRVEKATSKDRRHAPRTKPGSLLARIPVASFRELSTASPGYVEVDLVSHDGGKATGDHCYTLTVTDRCTGWTEIVPVPNRAQVHVFAALTGVLAHLAFPVQVLHSDNGSEFINDELRRYCDTAGIRFTRSRPYHKNDNCYVENRNWTLVRRCIGYHRFDTEEQLQDLTQLERLLALRANILQPSMALLQKVRTGSRIQKRYRPPLTPLRRLLQAPEVSDSAKARLLRELRDVDPISLQRDIGILQARLLGTTSQDIPLGAVTRATISL